MYKPNGSKKFPPIAFEFDVAVGPTELAHIKATGKHLLGYQFAALDDLTIGVVKDEADPSGALLAQRYGLKLGNVLVSLEGVDAEALSEAGDLAKFCAVKGNEEFCFRGWTAYCVALGSAYTKSGTENGNAPDDGGQRGTEEQSAAGAP